MGQSFVPTESVIAGVAVRLEESQPPIDGSITVTLREGHVLGPAVPGGESTSQPTEQGWAFFPFDAPVAVDPGSTYVIHVTASTPHWGWTGSLSEGDWYPFGAWYTNGEFRPPDDRQFQTYPARSADLPATPSNLEAILLEPGLVRLIWVDTSVNEGLFHFQASRGQGGWGTEGFVTEGTETFDVQIYDPYIQYFRIRAWNDRGYSEFSETATLVTSDAPSVGELDESSVILVFSVAPNPSSEATIIRYSLASEAQVGLSIHGPNGREFKRLVAGKQNAADYSVAWTGTGAGVYFVKLRVGDEIVSRRLVVID